LCKIYTDVYVNATSKCCAFVPSGSVTYTVTSLIAYDQLYLEVDAPLYVLIGVFNKGFDFSEASFSF